MTIFGIRVSIVAIVIVVVGIFVMLILGEKERVVVDGFSKD